MAILWGVFTFCSAILNIVVFLSEEWVGATDKAKSPGHFGLWKFCMVLTTQPNINFTRLRSGEVETENSGGSFLIYDFLFSPFLVVVNSCF